MDLPASVYWIWLSCFPFLRLKTRVDLLEVFGSPEGIFHAEERELAALKGISRETARLISETGLDRVDDIIDRCDKQNIEILTQDNPAYPFRLKNIYSPPAVIYLKGNMPDIDDSAVVSVIGTRKASQYGLRMGKKIAFELSNCGGVVVSLLTAGVDQAAAEGAILAGKPCIGVLGTAHDVMLNPVIRNIVENGALISEYPPGSTQLRSFFRDRNRIAAGISVGTVVVEAPEKSGTRFFVEEALEQGKDIFAVPGNADSDNSKGTFNLLKMGAKPAGSGWDVLSEYCEFFPGLHNSSEILAEDFHTDHAVSLKDDRNLTSSAGSSRNEEWEQLNENISPEHKLILASIYKGADNTDAIIETTGMAASKVLSNLTILEIKGLISRDFSGKINLKKFI